MLSVCDWLSSDCDNLSAADYILYILWQHLLFFYSQRVDVVRHSNDKPFSYATLSCNMDISYITHCYILYKVYILHIVIYFIRSKSNRYICKIAYMFLLNTNMHIIE